ncbi:F-box domain-containing protein [Heracleum sosnowskyi]|uniref:F-box domain-containing protein n=1 Tax=Heracleum sosnowskyi TaxID=360622 RepID=A0AAD8IAI5_9APIA|nr:F-box domain-containing protein [Heracleum sosnowskyi]
MSQKLETLKLENNDVISELPQEVLSQMISLLPLKEAVRTSILSKSWISKWTTHLDIVCDIESIIGFLSDEHTYEDFLEIQDKTEKFVERVDHIIQQRCKGPKLNSIYISFPLSGKDESQIASWIYDAVAMGVKSIYFDSTGGSDFVIDASLGVPTFPFSVLTAFDKACTVQRLWLFSCSLGPLSISDTLASLVNVRFDSVNFTDEQLDAMICNCLFLEKMVLINCPNLVNFKLTSKGSRLRFLDLQGCDGLKYIELYAENLEILEYTGQTDCFSFKHVPKLAEVYLRFYGKKRAECTTFALSRIAAHIPRLETLKINVRWAVLQPGVIPTLTNIVNLVLTGCPRYDEYKLCWINCILKAFPFLNKLQLNLFISSSIRQSEMNDGHLPEVTHANLRELEINGYHGSLQQVELLKFLVNSAVKLDLLMISPLAKEYQGSDDWFYREIAGNTLSLEKIEELRSIVPRTVQVIYYNL